VPLETLWGSQIVFCDQFQLKPSVAFYNTVVLEAAQEMLLGMCQASTNENFLPATPSYGGARSKQRRAWQDDGCSGLSRSGVAAGPIVPHSKKDSPTLQHSRILTQIPQIPHTQRRCPSARAIILGKADYFKPLCCFHYRKMGFIYPK